MSMRKSVIVMISGMLLLAAFAFHLANLPILQTIVLVISTILAGVPIMFKALQALRMRAFSIELLVTIAVVGALFIGEYVESAVVTFLFLFGAYLEARTLAKTRSALKELVDMSPLEAKVVRNGETMVLPVDEIIKGDRILVHSGEKIAVDGRILSGTALINEAAITGESIPARKEGSDYVYSGTIIDSGYIEVMAEKVGDDTTFAKIIELVEEAQETKAKTEKFIEVFANIYTPAIVILSILVFVLTRDIGLTLTFLVIACPGALVISAPVSIVAGIGNGAKHGILIKGGEVMEKLASVNAVLFDKTGTLTKGQPSVTSIHSFTMSEDELLQYTATAELVSEHVLGHSIIREADQRQLPFLEKPKDTVIIKGQGITGMIRNVTFAIGNRKLISRKGIAISDEINRTAAKFEKQGHSTVFIALDGVLAGFMTIADEIRPEASSVVQAMKDNRVEIVTMLSGDNHHSVHQVAKQLRINEVHAEMLPEEKLAQLRHYQENGYKVAMIGDGINDAPALAAADVGIAMGGSGTDVAMESAHVVLLSDNLNKLEHALLLSKATVRNMKQNTFIAVGTVILLLIGVLMKKVFLASGMLIHELSVLIVILNAIRLVRYNKKGWRDQHASTKSQSYIVEKGV